MSKVPDLLVSLPQFTLNFQDFFIHFDTGDFPFPFQDSDFFFLKKSWLMKSKVSLPQQSQKNVRAGWWVLSFIQNNQWKKLCLLLLSNFSAAIFPAVNT